MAFGRTCQLTRTRHLVLGWCLSLTIVNGLFVQSSQGVGAELILDDFEDGDFEGWSPLNALQNAGLSGTSYQVTSGRLGIASKEPVVPGDEDFAVLIESLQSDLYANGILRIEVETTHPETDAWIAIRTNVDNGAWLEGGHLVAFAPASAGGSTGIFNTWPERDSSPIPHVRAYQPNLGFQPNRRHNVEIVADGGDVAVNVWPVGEDRPDQPIVSIDDANLDGGGIAIGFSNSPPDSNPFSGFFDNVTFEQLMPGDFDNNKAIDAHDIDLLARELRQPEKRRIFDMNNDGAVTLEDREFLVTSLGEYTPGDTNLDRNVDFTDFLALSAGFGNEGGWADGDLNGDGTVSFSDFLILSTNFGPNGQAVASVPEATGSTLCVLGLVAITTIRRRRTRCLSQYR